MKKTRCMFGLALSLGVLFASCSQSLEVEDQLGSEQGRLNVTLKSGTELFVGTRALNEASYANTDNYTVIVTNKDGQEVVNCSGSELANYMPLTMPIGSYVVKAFYGEELAASRDRFYVYGEEMGSIKAEQEEPVVLTCAPTCGRITVNFAEEMATFYSNYNVVFSGTKAITDHELKYDSPGFVKWNKDDKAPWYVKLEPNGENVSFELVVTTKDEYINIENSNQVLTKKGTFSLARNKAYKMNVTPSYTAKGELDFDIKIDESTIDKEYDIEVPVDWIQ